MRKIESIEYSDNISKCIKVNFNDKQWAHFHEFGKTILTCTSEGVLKSTLSEFKKDILKSEWNIKQLREWYLKKWKE